MAKKLSRKLLAVILTLAICATTVLGCLITAYAATDGTYAFSEAVVNADSTQATMELAFEIPGDVTAGMFTLNEVNYDAADHLTLVGVTAEDGINATADTEELDAGVIANIIVDTENKCSAITVTLTFGFSAGMAADGKDYEISVSSAEFAYSVSSYYNSFTGTNGFITAGCEHVLTVTGEPLETDSTNGYSVYENSVCAKCGETFGYQVVPATEAFEDLNAVYMVAAGTDGVDAWNYPDGSFMTGDTAVGSGTETDPYIISTPGHFRYLAQKSTYEATNGKYFAVDPDIDVMVFQYESWVKNNGGLEALLALDSGEAVKDFFDTHTGSQPWQGGSGSEYFGGHIDGNGVELVGINTTSGGLFGRVSESASFENITISNSYITSGDYSGTLVAYATCSAPYTVTTLSDSNCPGVVSFENVIVKNNYVASTGNNNRAGALMGGCATYIGVKMDNCLVYGNEVLGLKDSANPVDGGLFGTLSAGHNGDTAGYPNGAYSNSVILGCVPYGNAKQGQAYKPAYFSNIYTDTTMTYAPCSHSTSDTTYATDYAGKIITISTANIEGLAAKANLELDFDNTWVLDLSGGYPTPTASVADTADRTSSSELNLKAVNLTYNDDGSFNINFYYTPAASGFVPELKVPKSDLSKYFTLTGTALGESEAAALGVKTGTLRYTIERLSAREIPDTLLPTVIVDNAGVASWGKTEAISIKDYAIAVISGEYDQADKNVAAALINYGDAAKAALETKYDGSGNVEKNIVYAVASADVGAWNAADGSFMTGDTAVGDGTKDHPYILSTPGHFRYLAQHSTYATTHGKYFAVDPDIDIMVFQYEGWVKKNGGIDKLLALDSGAEIQKYFEDIVNGPNGTNELVQWQGNTTISGEYFGGHLDGNGVQIVGMYNKTSALLGGVSEDATITNITLTNNYINTGDFASPLVAKAYCSATYTATGLSNDNCPGVVSFEKVVIKNNYIASTGNNYRVGVLLAGCETYIGIKMDTCLIYGNEALGLKDAANPVKAALFGDVATGHAGDNAGYPNGAYSDSIILGCIPHSLTQKNQTFKAQYYTNIYTDQAQTDYTPSTWYTWDKYDITIIDASKATGSSAATAMPKLDWNTTWIYGLPGEYPTLAQGVIETETAGEIWYWDGTAEAIDTTAHAGTAADPYIIENAQQLNYVAMKINAATSVGKHYKIADGVSAIILQSSGAEEIMALDSGAETKAYFESITPLNWMKTFGWVQFNGTFDGNNVPIYGLYVQSSSSHIGLFPEVDGGGDGTGVSGSPTTDDVGITFKNITIKNSYYSATGKRVGGIIGHSYGPGYGGCVNGAINFDHIIFANNYMYTDSTDKAYAGILGSNFDGELVKASNIIAYGNQTLTGNNVVFPMFATANNGRTDADGNFIHNTVTDSVLLGVTPYNIYNFGWRLSTTDSFENVYTDAAAGTVTDWKNGDYSVAYKETDIKHIEVSDAIGEGAITACPNLDWNTDTNTDGTWYTGNAWGYPAFEAAGIMPSITQNAYDALVLSNYDEYGETNPYFSMYASSLNLKTNPYIAFTFAFTDIPGGTQYKTNRDNITVTFKTASETITTTVGNGNGGVSAGWTNNEGAGRYHLYRLEGISVEDMCKDIQVTVSYDGTDYNFGTFSVEGFALELQNANKQDPCDYYATRAEAAKALLFYTQMVNARYGA